MVFVDSFALDKEEDYSEDEIQIFNYEADTLTRFLAQNYEALPFAEAVLMKVRNYFDDYVIIELDGEAIELSLFSDVR